MTNIKNFNAATMQKYSPMIGGDNLKHFLLLAVRDIGRKVGSTMGASGRTSGSLVYEQDGTPALITTKDGANTLKAIALSCQKTPLVLDLDGNEIPSPIYALAASAFYSVATQTEKLAGDGTTGTTVAGAALVENALMTITGSMSDFCRTIDKEAEETAQAIYDSAVKGDDITEEMLIAIATTSLNHDKELGEKLGKAIFKAGKYGYCFVDGSKGVAQDRIETVNGYTFACVNEPLFFNEGGRGVYEKAFILVSKDPIDEVADARKQKPSLKPIFLNYDAFCTSSNSRPPLIIFAPSIGGAARQSIELNFKKRGTPVIFVTFTNFHGDQQNDILEDIAISCGAKYFSKEENRNINDIAVADYSFYGSCERIFLEKGYFSIEIPKKDAKFDTYLKNLSGLMDSLDPQKDIQKYNWIQRRCASLVAGIIRVTVSGSSDAELNERIDSVTDAQLACFSSLRKGIVTGGGVALYNNSYSQYSKVFSIAKKAPIGKIIKNSGLLFNLDNNNLDARPKEYGYDVLKGEIRNFWEAPMILDPAESVAEAYKNACSIAKTLLMLENFNY